ncbi:MAG: hypothetical protein IPJ27_15695 [Candidatus Accumulibacter sp.]|uniref:Uncharacterized protein n=1 Tax=Candidatus Accumulibacter proximus TaxID=2954385 RepID=A0A935Q0Y6_9PROT|nr:hypothetical protein [Candidatus Accumulibacter proximus]
MFPGIGLSARHVGWMENSNLRAKVSLVAEPAVNRKKLRLKEASTTAQGVPQDAGQRIHEQQAGECFHQHSERKPPTGANRNQIDPLFAMSLAVAVTDPLHKRLRIRSHAPSATP